MIIHFNHKHAIAGALRGVAALLLLLLGLGCAREAPTASREAARAPAVAEPMLHGARWIGPAAGDGGAPDPAADAGLVHEFESPPGWGIESARLAIAARGAYVVYVNGVRAGEGSGEDVRLFNVRRELHWGRNVIAVAVAPAARENRPLAIIARLNIEYDEGIPATIVTGEEWRAMESPADGWTEPAFRFDAWPAAR